MATFIHRQNPSGSWSWQVLVRRKGYPRQSATFSTKGRAQVWAAGVESEMARGVFVSRAEAERTTLGEALARYEKEVLPTKRSQRPVRIQIRQITEAMGELSLASCTSTHIAAYRDKRLASRLSAQTAKHDLALLSRVFNVAIKEWGIALPAGNPVAQVKPPKMPQGRDRRLVNDEETRLLEAAKDYGGEIGAIITWAIETAMRRGEIAGMRWEHVDRKARVVLLPDTKNGTSRRVPLSLKAVAVLESLPRRIDGQVWSMRPDSISQAFERVCGAAGIKGMRFHDLRHEATSRLFEKGLNPMQVAAITGHKTLQMLKRYTHLRAEDLVALLDKAKV